MPKLLSKNFLDFQIIKNIFLAMVGFSLFMGIYFLLQTYIVPALACMLICSVFLSSLILTKLKSLNGCMVVVHLNGALYSLIGTYYFGVQSGFALYSLHSVAFAYVGIFSRPGLAYLICAAACFWQVFLHLLSDSEFCLQLPLPLFGFDGRFAFYMLHLASLAVMFVCVVLTMRSRLYANVIDKSLEHVKAPEHAETMNGLFSRMQFCEYIDSIESAQGANIALVDLDRFRKINDFYGFSCGDEVIYTAAKLLQEQLPEAVITRWGGEEFLVFNLNLEAQEFFNGCKAFLAELENTRFSQGFKVSASIGCLCIRSDFRTFALDEYLAKLEKNLADAKSSQTASKIITSNF